MLLHTKMHSVTLVWRCVCALLGRLSDTCGIHTIVPRPQLMAFAATLELQRYVILQSTHLQGNLSAQAQIVQTPCPPVPRTHH